MREWFTHHNLSQILFLNDLLLAPIAMLLVYNLSKKYVQSKSNPIYKKYFVKAIMFRLVSAIAMACVYQYYYHGGDTFTYFAFTEKMREILFNNPQDFIAVAIHTKNNIYLAEQYLGDYGFFINPSSKVVIWISFFSSFLFFNTYILISFVFTLFCFYGCWKIFRLFSQFYPHLEREFALSCLFLPSVCFWGTGILKDPLCLGALGALTYHIYKLFFERTKIFKRLVFISICLWLLIKLKIYIVLSFMPAYTFWILFKYKDTITSRYLKKAMSPIIFVVSIFVGIFVFIKLATFTERYALDSLIRTAKDTQNWLYYSSQLQGGSGYSLGNIDYSTAGIIKVFPKAVNVALFRPYLWEAKKPILIPAALEGLFSLFLTIRLLYQCGFMRFGKLILSNPEVQFCMVFSVIFAFSVGFTSFNFGSLVRYKIPLMPFYFMALFILADKEKKAEVNQKKPPIKPKTIAKKLVPA